MKLISALIVAGDRIGLEGLTSLIQEHAAIKVLGIAPIGEMALFQLRKLQPDVVIIDIGTLDHAIIDSMEHIRQTCPIIKMVVLGPYGYEEYLERILLAGVSGYLLKESSADQLILAIEGAYRGNSYWSPPIARKIINDYLEFKKHESKESGKIPLTGREREVLQQLAEGYGNREVARRLGLSPRTVETHRRNIMRKLDIHHLSDLVRYAFRLGVIA